MLVRSILDERWYPILKTTCKRLATALLLASLTLAGCSGTTKPTPDETASASKRPPLKIPASFPNEIAKRDFAIGAAHDGYYAEAKPLLEEALATAPDAAGYAALGMTRYNLNDHPGAIEAWTKAADLNPELAAEMTNNTGNALRDLKRTDEAMAAYRKALEMQPTLWQSAINLAALLKSQGQVSEAIAVLKTAEANNKENTRIASLLDSYQKEVDGAPKNS